jgi:BRCT domain type II-containing protein
MDDEAGSQTISASDFRFPGFTTAERSTFDEQFRSRRAVNRAIDSAAAEQRCVSRVYDGVDLELRNVSADNVDSAICFSLHRQFQ